MLYNILLFLHSWNRWIVLALALVVIFKAFSGWFGKKDFMKADNALGGAFIGTLHLQLVLGLVLYFVSPFAFQAFSTGEAMKNPVYRYWSVEHITVMIIAVAVAQTGRILSKKAATALEKHKKAAIFYTIALLLILSRIPFDRLFRAL